MKIPKDLGWGGSDQELLRTICDDLATDLAALKAAHDDLRAKYDGLVTAYNGVVGLYDDLVVLYNTHVHVDDAAVAEELQGTVAGEAALGAAGAVASGTLKTIASTG